METAGKIWIAKLALGKFYATPGERDIRREFDKILKARFEMEFRRCLLGRAGR